MDWEVFRPSRAGTLCLILLCAAFALMAFRLTRKVQALRSALFYWVSPGPAAIADAAAFSGELGSRFAALIRAHQENRILKEKMLEHSILEIQYHELLSENERLQDLLGLKSSLHLDAVPAVVAGRDTQNWTSLLWINKGSGDGIAPDAPVLAAEKSESAPAVVLGGLVGRVLERAPHASKVLLLSDPLSSVAAVLPRTGEQGLVQGRGWLSVSVEYLDPAADVQAGDEVATSGLGGLFPPGLLIGRITRVFTAPSGFKRAELKAAASPGRTQAVLVLKAGT